MKTLLVTLISFISLATVAQTQTVANSTDETAAIKKVIADESDAFFAMMWASLRRKKFNLEAGLRAYKGPALIVLGWQDPIGMSTLYSLVRAFCERGTAREIFRHCQRLLGPPSKQNGDPLTLESCQIANPVYSS